MTQASAGNGVKSSEAPGDLRKHTKETVGLEAANGPPPGRERRCCSVAVIGGGAGGLVAAKKLLEEGHAVTVFEQTKDVGGVWVYDEATEEDDLLGIRPDRKVVHSSMYASLRTNLPREVMSFADFPFLPRKGPGRDPRRFPTHVEVMHYLRDYADEFNLWPHTRLQTLVTSVKRAEVTEAGWQRWRVASRAANGEQAGGAASEEIFDAVVICTGHFTQPRIASLPGVEHWPGQQLHSHNYRTPAGYEGKVVVVIGAASSGEDISRELAEVAKEVYICARNWEVDAVEMPPNLHRKPLVAGVHADGVVEFADGTSTHADVLLHCTGYEYTFPFLEEGLVNTKDGRVEPLYEHTFVPKYAPSLAFMGLTFKVTPLPLFELTGSWIAKALSGAVELPSEEEMLEWQKELYLQLERDGVQPKHTHMLSGEAQWKYFSRVGRWVGAAPERPWRKELYERTGKNKRAHPRTYRDTWPEDDDEVRKAAWADMAKAQSDLCLTLSGFADSS